MRRARPALRKLVAAVAALAALASAPTGARPGPAADIAAGDRAWERRAEGHDGRRAARAPIEEAISAYRSALEVDPETLEARWKLLRSLFFLGEYVLEDGDEKLEIFTEGRAIAEAGIDRLAARAGGREALEDMEPGAIARALAGEPHAAAVYFWAGAHWGLWGRTRGKLAAARQGVAKKVRDYAEIVNALDDAYDRGSGHRLLGRLHAEAPRIPFVTGWVSRDTAVAELERAVALGGDDALGELYLIEALLEFRPERRREAVERLRRLVASEPDPAFLVEELNALADARALLAKISS